MWHFPFLAHPIVFKVHRHYNLFIHNVGQAQSNDQLASLKYDSDILLAKTGIKTCAKLLNCVNMNQVKNIFSRPARDPPGALPLHQVEDGCSKMLWRPSGSWGGRTALLKTKDKTKGKNSLLLVVAQNRGRQFNLFAC